MIGRQRPGGSVDEVAVRRDDELLELLGARAAPRRYTSGGCPETAADLNTHE